MEMTFGIFSTQEIGPFALALLAIDQGVKTLTTEAVFKIGSEAFDGGRAGEVFEVGREKAEEAMAETLMASGYKPEDAQAKLNMETTTPAMLADGWIQGVVTVKVGPQESLPVRFKFDVKARQTTICLG